MHLQSCDRSRGRWSEMRRRAQAASVLLAGHVVTVALTAAGLVLTVLMAWPGAAGM